MNFKLISSFKPAGDQPQAIEKILKNLRKGVRDQVLLGVTGSGKTFTLAKVIEEWQKPTLVISHNKILAAQLYSEFKSFFPKNAVKYFVSYYDYYQPEAYMPHTDTYIDKDAQINEEISRLRNEATYSLMTRKDVVIVASVSCIYGLGNPREYHRLHLEIEKGKIYSPEILKRQLVNLQYKRNDFELQRASFSLHGEVIEILPPYGDRAFRIEFFDDEVESISAINPFTKLKEEDLQRVVIYPATHFIASSARLNHILDEIEKDMWIQFKKFKQEGKLLEAQRIKERTLQDIEMIRETGYCSGIENYSLYFDGRKPGEPPACLLDYFPKDFLLIVDESHMTIPQIRGMCFGDRSRKKTLVKYGFRLPTALDNRPLKFNEFRRHINQAIYVSATPGSWELAQALSHTGKISEEKIEKTPLKDLVPSSCIVEQIIRPTYLLDPKVEVRPTKNQLSDLIAEIKKRVKKDQRVLVTVLTKRLAEELTDYLREENIKVAYLHSEIETLKRPPILKALREGKYDVLIGVNLLREGLDLPEVSLVAILDADKEGFLRSEWALIQTMGRAARHKEGKAILYADRLTGSMKRAIAETQRRRKAQKEYNRKYCKVPKSIKKSIQIWLKSESLTEEERDLQEIGSRGIPEEERKHLIKELTAKMELAAQNLEFERAALLRDQIKKLKLEAKK
ncbi:excinuclease ABC subunit UvrB [bacterium]|nr:excinuclease ABC subunit UvrB [bacterium]